MGANIEDCFMFQLMKKLQNLKKSLRLKQKKNYGDVHNRVETL